MKTKRPKIWRLAYLLFGACSSCYFLLLVCSQYGFSGPPGILLFSGESSLEAARPGGSRRPEHNRHSFLDLNVTPQQCEGTFPGLAKDIRGTVALGPFEILPSQVGGPIQVQIKNGQLFILQPEGAAALAPELLDAQTATLHQLHRAMITSPTPLPDTIITINVNDQPFGSAFSYTRPAFRRPSSSSQGGPPLTRAFLMPHFSFWAWPLPSIGSISRAAAAVESIESQVSFARKDRRLAWRGTLGWDSAHYPGLRESLLRVVAEHEDWADVQALHGYELEEAGDTGGATLSRNVNSTSTASNANALMIEDFCRYKYVLYTEGITYSGRLQFLQMCRSVLISPPIAWLQHSTHLVKPAFSSDFLPSTPAWEPAEGVKEAWPMRYPPEQANAIFVSPDWSDLERTVAWLEENPSIAQAIAERQRDLFVGRGYLSPAAEICYWRELIRGWSEAVRYESSKWEGPDRQTVAWEVFSLGFGTGKGG